MKKPYQVLPIAGTHIAGVRVKDPAIREGKSPIMLTEEEAGFDLREGTIRPFPTDEAVQVADKPAEPEVPPSRAKKAAD